MEGNSGRYVNEMKMKRGEVEANFKCLKGSIIAVEGPIGVGKTTLCKSLERYLAENNFLVKYYPEYRNDKFLSSYISDMKRYSFSFQTLMLCKRLETYRQAYEFSNTGGISILDRSLMGDKVFAKLQHNMGFFDTTDWENYLSLEKDEKRIDPDLIIYLTCDVSTALERISRRGILSETAYTEEYLENLNREYKRAILDTHDVLSVVTLDWNEHKEKEGEYLSSGTCRDILSLLKYRII